MGCTFDIVVIDDTSTDNSVAVIRQFMKSHPELPIKLLINQRNLGFGGNYAVGCFHGYGKYYRVICGDHEERLESLVATLREMGKADIVTTYLIDAQARSLARRLLSSTYTQFVNLIGGHKLRYYNGLPIIPRKVVMRWHSDAHGFGFQADLIVRLMDMGATVIEVPVVADYRTAGKTKAFSFRNIASVGNTLMEIFIRRVAKILCPQYVSLDPVIVKEFCTPAFGKDRNSAASNQIQSSR